MSEQMTFDELEWKRRQESYRDAAHGFKRKAERRLQDFVHDALRQSYGLVSKTDNRKAAA